MDIKCKSPQKRSNRLIVRGTRHFIFVEDWDPDQANRSEKGEIGMSNSVRWCFKPSQPQWTISGLRETLIKRYIVERTSMAEISADEQSEKVNRCRENLWNEIQLKGF